MKFANDLMLVCIALLLFSCSKKVKEAELSILNYDQGKIEVSFLQSDGGVISKYEWDFGDGTTLTTTDNLPVEHQYSSNDYYTIKCKVYTGSKSDIVSEFSENFDMNTVPEKLIISNLSIEDFPSTNIYLDQDWDTDVEYEWEKKPDVFVEIILDGETSGFETDVEEDCSWYYTLTEGNTFTSTDLTKDICFRMYDYDGIGEKEYIESICFPVPAYVANNEYNNDDIYPLNWETVHPESGVKLSFFMDWE